MGHQVLPPALQNKRVPNHPGGFSSIAMVQKDERVPMRPPFEYPHWDDAQKAAWNQEHFSPEEWKTCEDKIEFVIMVMILFFPFFGIIVNRMASKTTWITTPSQQEQMGGDFKTMATDGKTLYLHPQFVLYHTEWELIGVFLHELFHNILMHMDRGMGYDRQLANISMDYAVNMMVNDAAMVAMGYDPITTPVTENLYNSLPWVIPTHIIPNDPSLKNPTMEDVKAGNAWKYCCDERWRAANGDAMVWEDIYRKLMEEGRENAIASGTLLDSHGAWGKARADGEDGTPAGQDPYDPNWIRDALADAYTQLDQKDIGNMPAGLGRRIQEILNPPLPWYRLLAPYLRMQNHNVGFVPGDMRFNEPMLWTYPEPELTNVVFTFDTSGSMSDQEIGASIYQAKNILSGYPNMEGYAMFWDARVHDVIKLDDFEGTIARDGVHGGGGTNIKPQFDMMDEMKLDPCVVVCFTDGYVPWDAVNPDELETDVLWVITNDHVDVPKHQRYAATRISIT
jgi:predicted metal-dependent peptidase